MNVVSLFDGISCAFVAMERANIPVKTYTAFEIDKYAIKVSQSNNPKIVQKGDVKTLKEKIECDILIGGSPCTDLSIAKKGREGLKGQFSALFYEYIRIKKLLNPKWFILENVASMREEDKQTITQEIGVEPIMIDASLVSAQRRKRYFWTNIPTTLPTDKHIVLSDVLQKDVDEKYFIHTDLSGNGQACRVYKTDGKSVTLNSNGGGWGGKTGLYLVNNRIRRLTPIECERLQGLPDDYTAGISDTQRYKCCGNAFNVDVIAHILGGLG